MTAEEAKEYGMVDTVLMKKPATETTSEK